MRAVRCRAYGPIEDLRLEELEPVEPGPHELRIRVQSAGVNFPDVLVVQGRYQVRPAPPFTPGLEVAGTVLQVGEGVRGFSVGDEVMATVPWGGFAEEAIVLEGNAFPLPAGMSTDVAGGFILTYATSHHALVDRGRLAPGETLVVLGAAGGAGIAAVELGKALGARVVACASSPEKLALCQARGADAVIDYREADLKDALKAITGGQGVDVVFDPVGGPHTEAALRAMAWEGRYLVVGFASGEIPRIALNLPLLKGCDIVGVFWGGFAAKRREGRRETISNLIDLFQAGSLRPHIHARYPLDRAQDALRELAERRARGKVVLTPGVE